MITLEKIVESIKLQLKPHLTDDVIVHDEWLIEMINASRAAMVKSLYVAGDNFVDFYQEIQLDSISQDTISGTNILFDKPFEKIVLPTKIMSGIGKKNIQYLGSYDYSVRNMDNVSFSEFINYSEHRFGSDLPCYTDFSDSIMIKNTSGQKKWLIRSLFEFPNTVPNYVYESTPYPIGLNNHRQLEIITFQHIAQKLGMPVDLLNNGMDETKNANIGKQAQQPPQEQEQ